MSAYVRDRETARTAAGVRLSPQHILSKSVHAFKTFTGDSTLQTWCDIPADLKDGASQTRETITCQACAQASFQNTQQWLRGRTT
jgi:hypothetical protein